MKINFTSLMYFQKVAELEHLTKAAEALHIAQPALSRTIRSMEEELDVSLFTHQGRNIHLTRDGHILLKYTNKILGSLDDLRQELQDSRDLQQLTVKLAIMSSSRLIPAFLMKFKEEYPETILEIVPQNSDSANASKADLTLFSSLKHIDNDHTITLFRENLVMVFPTGTPYAHLPYVNLHDLSDMDFIMPPKGFLLRKTVEAYSKKAGFTPKVILESDNPDTVGEFIRAGLGIALVPQMTWHNAQIHNVALPVGDQECHRDLNISWKTDSKLSLSAVLLREYIVDHFWEFVRDNANKTFPMQ